jgi:hypothetical protein
MKNSDIASAIAAAAIGIFAAYFLCNAIIPAVPDASFKMLTDTAGYDLTEPNEEVFNYRALNPTVEVYVGDCDEYDIYGNCIDDNSDEDVPEEITPEEGTPEETTPEESDEETPSDETQEEPEEENNDGSTN